MSRFLQSDLSRRNFFKGAGVAGLTCVAAGSGLVPGQAEASEAEMIISETFGEATGEQAKVTLKAPDVAENGALVKVPIKVDHPMEAGNYIEKVGIYVMQNPKPLTALFELTPEAGAVDLEVRIKMAKSSELRILAKSNTGKIYQASKNIKVAKGGCVG